MCALFPRGFLGILLDPSGHYVQNAAPHHAADRLQREQVLRPDLGHVKRVEVKVVLVGRAHCLDAELPLRVVAALDSLVEVGGRVAVVAAADGRRVVVQQILLTCRDMHLLSSSDHCKR